MSLKNYVLGASLVGGMFLASGCSKEPTAVTPKPEQPKTPAALKTVLKTTDAAMFLDGAMMDYTIYTQELPDGLQMDNCSADLGSTEGTIELVYNTNKTMFENAEETDAPTKDSKAFTKLTPNFYVIIRANSPEIAKARGLPFTDSCIADFNETMKFVAGSATGNEAFVKDLTKEQLSKHVQGFFKGADYDQKREGVQVPVSFKVW